MKRTLTTAVLGTLSLSACFPTDDAKPGDPRWTEAEQVKFIGPSQTQRCKFIRSVSLTQNGSTFGQNITETLAQGKLRLMVVDAGGNSIRITDRVFDKSNGGYDRSRMTYYADFYKC